tara:strand:+ start:343 stop:558 length:216 start_codon:yes stop_codon:yes gene_type:complete
MSLERQTETARLILEHILPDSHKIEEVSIERAEMELSRSLKFYLDELRKEGASIEDAKVLVFKMCNEIFVD